MDNTPQVARVRAGPAGSPEAEIGDLRLEDRERIFEPYRRGNGERRARGAGLGLTICRHIVERHGGRIWVGAARGGGNRFCFTLPA